MIIEFSVENFLSIKDMVTLSMISAKSFKEHKDTNLIHVDKKLELLKSAVIYGNNASGKSNILSALSFMKKTVLTSFRDSLLETNERRLPSEKFALNSKSETEPSQFEMSFLYNSIKYRYGFEIDNEMIVAEWLFHTTSKEVYLFRRTHQNIEVNKSSFKEGLGKETEVRENVLFITLLSTLNQPISKGITAWFQNLRFIDGFHDNGYKSFTIKKIKSDPNFFNWIAHFIKYLEISNVSTTEEEIDKIEISRLKQEGKDEEFIRLSESLNAYRGNIKSVDQLLTYHRKYDEDNVLIDTIPFNFERQESHGTKKLIYLLGPWYDALRNGRVLVIDELDSKLHSNLTRKLIEFFHKYNKHNAQLIFAVHDVSLLNKDIFRRDQIWFVEKNQFGASELLSLGDFKTDKVRNKSAFDKNYIQGTYGAIPYFEITDKLSQLLYGEE